MGRSPTFSKIVQNDVSTLDTLHQTAWIFAGYVILDNRLLDSSDAVVVTLKEAGAQLLASPRAER